MSDIFATAFPDGSKFCVYVKEGTNVIEIFAIYPPRDGIPEEPYANRTSEILIQAFGGRTFNWNDLAPFAPKGFCKDVDLKEIRRVLLSNPHIIAVEQILKLLSVEGVATAIVRDSFKESIEWLQDEKSVSMEQIL